MTGWSLYQDVNTGLWRCQKDLGRIFWFPTEMQAKQWLADHLNGAQVDLAKTALHEVTMHIGPLRPKPQETPAKDNSFSAQLERGN